MTIGLVGDGPAVEALRAALTDIDATAESILPSDLDTVAFAVVVGDAGDAAFQTANDAALSADTTWLAIERGGLGGHELDIDVGISGFAPSTGCFECLGARVAANHEAEHTAADPDPTTMRVAGALAGRELAKLVSGEDSALLGGVLERPHASRQFLPVPNCRCEPNAKKRVSNEFVARDLDDSLARAERAIDERVGIIHEVGEAASFPVPYYIARGGDTSGFSDASAAQQAAGVAIDWNEALMKAAGEALERYCAGIYRTSEFTQGQPSGLPNAVKPSEFVLPWKADDDAQLPWVEGERLVSSNPAFLPAEFVHFPPPTQQHKPAITTGLGLGNSLPEALLSGLYEVVERDATMLAWYSSFESLRLDIEDETFDTLVRRARSEDLEVTPLLVTQDVDIPVVAVAVHRDGDWPRFAMGSGADSDATAAATSALAEALQNWTELGSMGENAAMQAGAWIGHYASFPNAAQAFVDVDASVSADAVSVDVAPENELPTAVQAAESAGMEVYATRLTTRDVEALGFEATRVLIPQAQPLFMDEPYFGTRAETVPEELGFEPQLDREPHPYP
ncbi:YcaO-like family protein [Haladaptatus sp. GCM10025707]|uniref:YcaO-like family protein n=1 Tax=unclassified Haladaptatus TaxID=2622732 RepID=UPI0023E77876|nr:MULTISPECIES: YcaO-like family protein [unclassified Haladaptatus]